MLSHLNVEGDEECGKESRRAVTGTTAASVTEDLGLMLLGSSPEVYTGVTAPIL